MFERMMCIVVSLLSLVSIYYSSQHMEITQENEYAVKSNYVDVLFTDVEAKNGTSVSITPNNKGIVLDNVSLKEVGDKETIQYELYNNSLSYDVEVTVLVNGSKEYKDGTFHITSSDIGEIKSGERKSGTLEISYESISIENKTLPLDVQLQIEPKQKGYLA